MAYQTPSSDLGVYGNGSDGDVTITAAMGTVTLSRNMYYRNLIVESGAVLYGAGWQICVQFDLLCDGLIHNRGSSASGSTGGAGAAGGFYKAGATGENGSNADVGA